MAEGSATGAQTFVDVFEIGIFPKREKVRFTMVAHEDDRAGRVVKLKNGNTLSHLLLFYDR
jgi:hypothetical protein